MKQMDLHRPNRATYALIASSAAVLLLAPRSIEAQSADQAAKLPDLKALRLGQPTLLENGLARSLIYDLRDIEPLPPGVEFKASHLEKERGIELVSLYRKAAPAVLFILLEGGHGSGFLINKDGWLVTNHHVAEHGTLQEDLSREVTVMFGRFNDQGAMEALSAKYRAVLYKWDKIRDLALLKLKEKPPWAAQLDLPVIKVAEKNVNPGDDVMAIGHAGVTLLWSMKPGVVQGVGRRLSDLAGDFASKELRSEQSWKSLVKSHDSELEKEIEKELQPMRNVMVVQATCPILEGDSGGPLLGLAEGAAVGITSYYNARGLGGAAHFFIHAGEIRDFVKEVPDSPMQALASFWDTPANQVNIVDLDTNGQPETIVLSRIARTSTGFLTNVVGFGWDLAEQSELKPFVRKTPTGTGLDIGGVCRTKAMRLQVYLVKDNSATVCAYDLDNDGRFELVRIASGGSGQCSSELYAEAPDKPYQARRLAGKQSVLLPISQLPEAWRARYETVVLRTLQQKRAD